MKLEAIESLDIEGEIAKLPIAYYAGRPVDIAVADRADFSYYDAMKDLIVISKRQVQSALLGIDEKKFDPRTDIRPIPYHEVGHAILTPRNLYCYLSERTRDFSYDKSRRFSAIANDILNIFEDERIETILATTFMHVDFRRHVKLVNSYDRSAMPQTDMSLFYQVVRFHYTPFHLKRGLGHYLQRVKAIIFSHARLSRASDSKADIVRYCRDIDDLYFDLEREFDAGLSQTQTPKSSMAMHHVSGVMSSPVPAFGDSDPCASSSEDGDESDDKSNGQSEEVSQSDSESISEGSEAPSGSEAAAEDASGVGAADEERDDSVLSDIDAEVLKSMSVFGDACREVISADSGHALTCDEKRMIEYDMADTKWSGYVTDDDVVAEATQTFEAKSRADKRNSAAIPCYSGVIEPKLVGRKDWRVWLNKSRGGAYKMFSKTHLNLFVDNSGSFADNKRAVNTLICSLAEVEKRVPDFTFDVVRCDTSFKICDRQHRLCSASGGTKFDESVCKIYAKLQQRDAINYNIMLVDGDDGTTSLFCPDIDASVSPDDVVEHPSYDGELCERVVKCKPYVCFNHATDIIITDAFNCAHIEKQAPRARIVSMRDRRYSEELISTVMSCIKQIH